MPHLFGAPRVKATQFRHGRRGDSWVAHGNESSACVYGEFDACCCSSHNLKFFLFFIFPLLRFNCWVLKTFFPIPPSLYPLSNVFVLCGIIVALQAQRTACAMGKQSRYLRRYWERMVSWLENWLAGVASNPVNRSFVCVNDPGGSGGENSNHY